MKRLDLTERGRHVGDESDYTGGDEEVLRVRIEADHGINDDGEYQRHRQKYRRFRQGLADEIDIGAIHTVPVLAKEYRQFGAEHLSHITETESWRNCTAFLVHTFLEKLNITQLR